MLQCKTSPHVSVSGLWTGEIWTGCKSQGRGALQPWLLSQSWRICAPKHFKQKTPMSMSTSISVNTEVSRKGIASNTGSWMCLVQRISVIRMCNYQLKLESAMWLFGRRMDTVSGMLGIATPLIMDQLLLTICITSTVTATFIKSIQQLGIQWKSSLNSFFYWS